MTAKPAAAPAASLFQLNMLAAPVNVTIGAEVVKVPLEMGPGPRVTLGRRVVVGAWGCPSLIWETPTSVVVGA